MGQSFYEKDGLKWNFCAYLPGTQVFAALVDDTPVTGWKATVDKVEGLNKGIKTTRKNGSICGSEDHYSFTTVVNCDSKIEGQGKARIDKVEGADTCDPIVYLSHAAGCIEFDPDDYSWFEENKIYFVLLALIVGPITAFGGKRLFPYVAATVISLFTFFVVLIICSISGGFGTTLGLVLSILAALVFAIAVGICTRRCFWFNVAVLGAIAGLCLGAVLYSLIAISFEVQSEWAFGISCVIMGIIGGIYAWYRGEQLILWGTSLIGSYVTMRGIAAFYGGFPEVNELKRWAETGETIEKPALFYVSILIFIVIWFAAVAWQKYKMNAHESLA